MIFDIICDNMLCLIVLILIQYMYSSFYTRKIAKDNIMKVFGIY